MQNLFALKSRYRLAYWLVWVLFAAIYAAFLVFSFGASWFQAGLDALAFGVLFALMGVAVWYIVMFSGLDSTSVVNTLTTHVVAGGALVFTIVAAVESTLALFIPGQRLFYDFGGEYHIYRLLAGGLIYIFLTINFYLVFYYEEYRSKKLREVELDQNLKSAELNMLKAQINPHFVFNSLNSVSSLTLTNPEKAHDMVIQLAEFLRYSIRKNADQMVELEQEIEAIELYLEIEKTRYGSRLTVEVSCEDELKNKKLPALIIQPVIENAIKYSLHETDLSSKIKISCRMADNELKLSVINNFDSKAIIPKGEGIGLANIRSRLKLVYGRNDLLQTGSIDNLFTTELSIPQL